MSVAGRIMRAEGLGRWWAAVPKDRWPPNEQFQALMRRHWSPTWGDRRQELVFIGDVAMDEAAIRAELDDCLVGHPATGLPKEAAWPDDPFPDWELRAA